MGFQENLKISEQTLIEAVKVQKKSKYFHNEKKGCKIEEKLIPTGRHSDYLKGAYCKTHQKDLCRCGWEWSHHYEK